MPLQIARPRNFFVCKFGEFKLRAAPRNVHPQGEVLAPRAAVARAVVSRPLAVDTLGRRFHVEWDPHVHVTALRADAVHPQGLGLSKVCSEDSVRRAFADADPAACAAWQAGALRQTWPPALRHGWILDLDVTVKPIYGRQEGAEVGYNPHKPGRPSHAYHTLFVRHLRLVLDVEVRSGKQHAATHSRDNLWRVWEHLPREHRPWLVCGDASYGHEGLLAEGEARGPKYRFRLRRSVGVKQLIGLLERQGGGRPGVHG